ncbi:hypothetical protein LH51_01215 [Nitrincola sp. A-D6]|uniref:hypothetical protein n=1 Tax=Nitrincola sp. A-D6 TaxID=1545442 RepID=UPI00051FB885|nr:hypothetical protein [Nitrincola sp. A-D6]KGK43280.1 hypothetical protein LH51_01215 [Nitrincola sp. A-D6]
MSDSVAALLGLEQQLRKASDLAQLFYTLVNQTHTCVPYTQALLLVGENLRRPRVEAASDIPAVDYTSPFINWIERLSEALLADEKALSQRVVKRTEVPDSLAREWKEFGTPDYLLWQPLVIDARGGRRLEFCYCFVSRAGLKVNEVFASILAAVPDMRCLH